MSGADALHIDIMDGHFVPNLSMGPSVVEMAKSCVAIPLSVHLMMTRPDRYVDRFIECGADSLLIHIESECDAPETLKRIREQGARCGITLNPETRAEMVFPVISETDEVLCMTVRPGYGGQAFMPEVLPKIRTLRDYADSNGIGNLDILVDGGIDAGNAGRCAAHGANVLIVGTALYEAADMAAEVALVRQEASRSFRVST